MADEPLSVGIIGGSGMLGSAIARVLLERGVVTPASLWISNRSGRADGFEAWPGINVTTDNAALVTACRTVLLSVPPAHAAALKIDARERLVLSVMAGVTVAQIKSLAGASRVIRAMSSPAAALGLAYSPWFCSPEITETDRAAAARLFGACGATDEIDAEEQIDLFTALTGPVPGFVACLAECMTDYAVRNGVSPGIADRAVRQLFHASGVMMAESDRTPHDHVEEMIAYAGTTAAGLEALRASPLSEVIGEGLDASRDKAKRIAEG
jgi:pyrroline-5-carboxylate reductase